MHRFVHDVQLGAAICSRVLLRLSKWTPLHRPPVADPSPILSPAPRTKESNTVCIVINVHLTS